MFGSSVQCPIFDKNQSNMSSNLIATVHIYSVFLFLLIYLFKTVFLFSSQTLLDKFTRAVKVPEMIISTLFLVSGVWLFVILGGIKTFHIIKLVLVFIAIPLAIIGFKKRMKFLALISFMLIIGAYGLAEMSKNKPFMPAKVVVTNDDGSAMVNGARIYSANCVFCHGQDGKKNYRTAKDLSMTGLDINSIQAMVHDGVKGKMPAYGSTLSYQEIADVAAYVLTLQKTADVPPAQ